MSLVRNCTSQGYQNGLCNAPILTIPQSRQHGQNGHNRQETHHFHPLVHTKTNSVRTCVMASVYSVEVGLYVSVHRLRCNNACFASLPIAPSARKKDPAPSNGAVILT